MAKENEKSDAGKAAKADGDDVSPNRCICSDNGMLSLGVGLLVTTSVAAIVAEPVSSVAMMSTGIPTTSPGGTSPSWGVPERRPMVASIESHVGAFLRL